MNAKWICLLFVTITVWFSTSILFFFLLWNCLFSLPFSFCYLYNKTLLSKFSQSAIFNMKPFIKVHVEMTLCLNIRRQGFKLLICYLSAGYTLKNLVVLSVSIHIHWIELRPAEVWSQPSCSQRAYIYTCSYMCVPRKYSFVQ